MKMSAMASDSRNAREQEVGDALRIGGLHELEVLIVVQSVVQHLRNRSGRLARQERPHLLHGLERLAVRRVDFLACRIIGYASFRKGVAELGSGHAPQLVAHGACGTAESTHE